MADPPTRSLVSAAYDGRFRTFATVLESPEHGPQLCQSLLLSLPPRCGGPEVAGWDWSAVAHEAAAGSRWGDYILVGTFDGETFTLTEPPTVDDGRVERPSDAGDPFATPCPEPEGGWRPVDPARATQAALQEAIRLAQAADGYGGLWVDQRVLEAEPTDPQRLVLNVTTTKDIAALHNAIREVWGGSLCVSRAVRDEASLLAVQQQVDQEPGILTSAPDHRSGQLVVEMFVASPERQRCFDERYGTGTVRLEGVLVPID